MHFRATSVSGLFLALLLGCGAARAQQSQPSEYQLKAAFLYHFAEFVDWPASAFVAPTSPMIIGILGDNPFGNELEQAVRGKSLNNHPLSVRSIGSVPEATTNCHILFISSSEKKRLPEIFTGLGQASVLTVGEMDRFNESGGMINFVLEGTKIRFQINDAAARRVGLKISSKLMSLATRKAP
jgi:hypothetical protein